MQNKELLFSLTKKDFIVETFRSGGPGGQNQNKRNTGVRIRHPESGAVAESREHRTQKQNQKAAFERLVNTPEFKRWHKIKVGYTLRGIENYKREIEKQVKEAMKPENLKIEYGVKK